MSSIPTSPVAQEKSISCSQSIVNFHNEGVLKLSASTPFITKLHITDEGDAVDSTAFKVLKVFALAIAAIPLCIYHFAYTLVSKIIDCCSKSKSDNDAELNEQEAKRAEETAATNRAALRALPTGAASPATAAARPSVTNNGSRRVTPRPPVDTSSLMLAGLQPVAHARKGRQAPSVHVPAAPLEASTAASSPVQTGDLFDKTPKGQHFIHPAFPADARLEAMQRDAIAWGGQQGSSAASAPLARPGTTTFSESGSLTHVTSTGSIEEVAFHAETEVSPSGTGTLLASFAASTTDNKA